MGSSIRLFFWPKTVNLFQDKAAPSTSCKVFRRVVLGLNLFAPPEPLLIPRAASLCGSVRKLTIALAMNGANALVSCWLVAKFLLSCGRSAFLHLPQYEKPSNRSGQLVSTEAVPSLSVVDVLSGYARRRATHSSSAELRQPARVQLHLWQPFHRVDLHGQLHVSGG